MMRNFPDELALTQEENFTLKAENLAIKKKVADLQAEIAELNKTQPEPISQITPDELRVLTYMDAARDFVYADGVSNALGLAITRVDWLLGRLVASNHIYETPNVPSRYKIEQKGRDAIHNPSA